MERDHEHQIHTIKERADIKKNKVAFQVSEETNEKRSGAGYDLGLQEQIDKSSNTTNGSRNYGLYAISSGASRSLYET